MGELNDEQKLEIKRAKMREYMRNRRKTILTENGKSYSDYIYRLNYDYRQREKDRKTNYRLKKQEWKEFQKSMPYFLTN